MNAGQWLNPAAWSPVVWLILALSALMLAWFFAGHAYNRRRGQALLDWLQAGLSRSGQISRAQRVGRVATGAQLIVEKAEAPFQWVEAVFVLEPRENLLQWVFYRFEGRRDESLLKANLRTIPTQELDAALETDPEFRQAVASDQKKPFELLQAPHNFAIARRGHRNPDEVKRLRAFLEEYAAVVVRVSVRRKEPHLVIRLNAARLLARPPEAFFESLSELFK